jgi:hypothetical protein
MAASRRTTIGRSLQHRRNFLLALATFRAHSRVMCGISGHSLPVGIFAARTLENARVSGFPLQPALGMTQT